MAEAAYQQYQQQMDHQQQQHPYYSQPVQHHHQQQMAPPQSAPPQQHVQYGQQPMPHPLPPPQQQQMAPQHQQQMVPAPVPQQQQVQEQPQQQMGGDGQPGGDEYSGNPIPMTPGQLAALLDNIALLDTQRIILEPGVMIGETGQILNLSVIRTKVNSPSYSLPEMLVDLNSICEPFLNQGPDHAAYATQFLDQANQAIVDAVREAQYATGAPPPSGVSMHGDPGQQGGYGMMAGQQQQGPQHQQGGYAMDGGGYMNGSRGMGMMDQGGMHRGQPSSWMAEVVGEDGQPVMVDPNAAYMNGGMARAYPGAAIGHMGSTPDMMGKKKGKRGPEGMLSPEREKRANTAPRPRLEGRRCQVCAVIKKAGCGTENAHFRCLKKKKPDIAIELERRVGELKDVGEEERVTVWNPKEGRKLSGQAAPMLKNLAGWLASHPGWEAHPRVTTTNAKPRAEGENSPQFSSLSAQPTLQQQSPMMAPQQYQTPSPAPHQSMDQIQETPPHVQSAPGHLQTAPVQPIPHTPQQSTTQYLTDQQAQQSLQQAVIVPQGQPQQAVAGPPQTGSEQQQLQHMHLQGLPPLATQQPQTPPQLQPQPPTGGDSQQLVQQGNMTPQPLQQQQPRVLPDHQPGYASTWEQQSQVPGATK